MSRNQPDHDQLLRDMRNDLRFLSYRAGRPHPFLLKYVLFSLLLIFGLTFLAELSVTFFGPIHGSRHQPGSANQISKEVQP
jgi:hypothetical protein